MRVQLGLFIPPKIKAYTHIIQSTEERLQGVHGKRKKYKKKKFAKDLK